MRTKKILLTLISIGIYLFSTGVSYAAFIFIDRVGKGISFTSPLPSEVEEETPDRRALVEITGSQTESCPLNGAKYTKTEKKIWETRRPLAVMIENHLESRNQSGVSDADIVYETVAEGGITRFLAIFYCRAAAYESILGPVRSARTYFVDWASEYNQPLYTHVGGANTPGPANALGQIVDYGWSSENDLNQFSIGFPTFWRDYERLGRTVATEHTMYSTTEKLWAAGKKRGYTNVDLEDNEWSDDFQPWKFVKKEPDFADRDETNHISYNFWAEYDDYQVDWEYNKENNLYNRKNGQQDQKDFNIDKQLNAKNIVVQFVTERKANDGYPGNLHLLYGTIGSGKALIFQNGQAIKGNWSKANRLARTIFTDNSIKEIQFNPGTIWISVLPIGAEVNY